MENTQPLFLSNFDAMHWSTEQLDTYATSKMRIVITGSQGFGFKNLVTESRAL